MRPITVLSQWQDLDLPPGVRTQTADGDERLTAGDLDAVDFYIPRYRGGAAALRLAERMPHLEVVQLLSVGYDEAERIISDGVTLCNASGVHDEATAELAVGLTIAVRRNLRAYLSNQAVCRWVHSFEAGLTGCKVAVLGNGGIGSTVGRIMRGFDVRVTSFNRTGRGGATKIASFLDSISSFDVIVVCLPLTDETAGIISQRVLHAMKDGAALINVGRGRLVDNEALVDALSAGRIWAGLDVTDPEPLDASSPLWRLPNCIITPHVGGDTAAFEPRARRLVEGQVRRFVAGEPLLNVVRTARGTKDVGSSQKPLNGAPQDLAPRNRD